MEPRASKSADAPDRGELDLVDRLSAAVGTVLKGKPETIRLALTALLARGHLLVEDVPGVGKTTLAAALARAVGGRFVRVQFTSDMLPSDLIGVSVFDPQARRFEFRPGPIFANVVLADEINRTTPKTQSALLEAMSERRVSVDGVTRSLPDPFFVVATQNPVEHHGTFPLPDSQLDRFLLRISIGYPSPADEREILASDRAKRDVDDVPAVTEPEGLAHLQQAVERVRASELLLDYMVAIAHATRRAPGVAIGVSPARDSRAAARGARHRAARRPRVRRPRRREGGRGPGAGPSSGDGGGRGRCGSRRRPRGHPRGPRDRARTALSAAHESALRGLPSRRAPGPGTAGSRPTDSRHEPGRRPGPASVPIRVSRMPRSTPLGRRAGLLGIGLLFAGLNTGNNLFYLVFTVMAASELVGFLVAGRALRRLRAEVTIPRRGRAGAPLRITLRLSNESRWLPIPALRWKMTTAGGDETEVVTPALAPGSAGSGTARLVPRRRGWLGFETAEARTEFPLGLARRIVRLGPVPAQTLVTPSLDPARHGSAGKRRGDVRRLAHPTGLGEEPIDAREYVPGDDARRIDWRASARTERLMWRDRRGEPPLAIRVRLDRSGAAGPAFERRVSRAAGTAVSALAMGRPVGFESDDLELLPRSGPAQRRRILDYLALVAPLGESR